MTATVIPLPATGWCVRAGAGRAHFLGWSRRGAWSACGRLERIEEYVSQRLRQRQWEKPRCLVCEAQHTRRVSGESC